MNDRDRKIPSLTEAEIIASVKSVFILRHDSVNLTTLRLVPINPISSGK